MPFYSSDLGVGKVFLHNTHTKQTVIENLLYTKKLTSDIVNEKNKGCVKYATVCKKRKGEE